MNEYKVHQVWVYIGCAPGGTTSQISDFAIVSSFNVTLFAKCYFTQTICSM